MPAQGAAQWVIAPRNEEFERRTALALGIHPLLAAVLYSRGLTSPHQIEDFLQPSADQLHSPETLPDIGPATERIVTAIQNQETVLVHGDYDADGICSAALLTRFLSKLGVDVNYYIPHRIKDSYGLNQHAVQQATDAGIKLIIAADCGVTAHEAVAAARRGGADVVVVDHHEPDSHLPQGAWIIDPKRPDNQYPERELAAVGLCFKLATAVCERLDLSQQSLQRAFLDLVALGTIADMAPLVGENRTLTALGLKLMPNTRKVGLQALLKICKLDSTVRASDVAFRLAPRLNAVGRMADATQALELLLTDDKQQALRQALHLDSINRERQQHQQDIYYQALRRVEEEVDLDQEPVIVLSSPDWHVGVVGIVASKLLERFHRPAIVLVEENGRARGSARSIAGFDISEGLRQCADMLLEYGGHAAAAGLTLQSEKVDAFRQHINAVATATISPEDTVPQLKVDAQVELAEIDGELAEDLARLGPCGQANPEPLFVARGVEVIDCETVGHSNQHLKVYVATDASPLECIGFGMADQAAGVQRGGYVDICFTPEIDEYQGRRHLQLRLAAIQPAQPAPRS